MGMIAHNSPKNSITKMSQTQKNIFQIILPTQKEVYFLILFTLNDFNYKQLICNKF
jgi:hypothetical protein